MARTPGSINKSTEQVRRAVSELLTRSAPKMVEWLDMVAYGNESLGVKADPGKAVDLVLKAAEYHIPKLARTEVLGDPDKPLFISKIELVPMNGKRTDPSS